VIRLRERRLVSGIMGQGESEEKGVPGGKWHWRADDVARRVRDGKTQREVWGWDKTLLQMEVFDSVSGDTGGLEEY
jgi:hypothetical protein